MNTLDWQRAEEAFHRVLDAPPEAREALLAALPADLRSLVESLLHSGAAEDRIARAIQGAATLVSEPPVMAGAYRLVRQIGEGGMGAVYLAVRADDAFDKQVAVKFVRRGMESDLLRRRFDSERRILARLEHPFIARLLDAGQTPDALPYLVMEYVEGQAIVEHATARNLSVRQRVQLFLEVCGAVQYAHQNLIVHRDLKPGNIMIDSSGSPKLLDFGIARLLDAGAPSPSATAVRLLTPDYASPEQMRGEPAGIPSDIYSLGAVLYELLAGSPPFRLSGLSPADAERAVTTSPLEKPSRRNLQFRRQLQGDLDNIVLMAMRKDPRERYATAAAFAADLERYLQGRPVQARDYRPWERAWKFLLRHRVAAAAAFAVLLSVTTAFVIARRSAIRTGQQRAIADAERRKADAAARLAEAQAQAAAAARKIAESRYTGELQEIEHMLGHIEDIHSFPGTGAARVSALEKAIQSLERMAAESPGDARVRLTTAIAYARLGHLLARDVHGPGQFDRGIALLENARQRFQGMLRDNPSPSLDLLMETVETSSDLGCALGDVVDDLHAIDVYNAETARWSREMRRLYPASEKARFEASHAASCRILTSIRRDPGKADPQEIAAMRLRIEAAYRKLPENESRISELADWIAAEGLADSNRAQHPQALERFQAEVALRRRAVDLSPVDMDDLRKLNIAYSQVMKEVRLTQGSQSPAIEEIALEMVAIGEKLAADPSDRDGQYSLAASLTRLAGARMSRGDAAGALEPEERGIAILRKLLTPDEKSVSMRTAFANYAVTLGDIRDALGRGDPLPPWRDALAEAEALLARGDQQSVTCHYAARAANRLAKHDNSPEFADRSVAWEEKAAAASIDPVYQVYLAQFLGDAALVYSHVPGGEARARQLAARSVDMMSRFTDRQMLDWPAAGRDQVKALLR